MPLTNIDIRISGKPGIPLILRNGHLADPLNCWAKAIKKISSKKTKTDEDHEEMSRLDFIGGLYIIDKGVLVIPSDNIEMMVGEAARKLKLGKEVKSSLTCMEDAPIIFTGPQDPEKLYRYKDGMHRHRALVGLGTGKKTKVLRCRPKFPVWALEFSVTTETEFLPVDQVRQFLDIAATRTGFMERRPKYRRFIVEKFEASVLQAAA